MKAKQKLLKFFGDRNGLFLKLLEITYNPYNRFGSRDNAAKELSYFDIELDQGDITLVFKKNLKLGIGARSINQVYPDLIPQHDVMLAKPLDASRLEFPLIASPKLDGLRGIFHQGTFYTRNGHIIPGLTKLQSVLTLLNEPYDFDLDGELTVNDAEFNTASGLLRSKVEVENVVFNLIDIPGTTFPFSRRYEIMKRIGFINPMVKYIPHKLIRNEAELDHYYNRTRDFGFEGLVVKPLNYKYVQKRSYDWMKIKPEETEDLLVFEVYEGQGLFAGMLGGIVVDYKGKKVKVGSGFSMEERQTFWADPNRIVGKIVEVAYMEETPYGSLRFPVFKELRYDKS